MNNKKVVKFWGENCAPCKSYAPIFEKVKNEISNEYDFEFLNIDARNDNTGLTSKLGIRSVPQTFILDENDMIIDQKKGYLDEDTLKKFIIQHV